MRRAPSRRPPDRRAAAQRAAAELQRQQETAERARERAERREARAAAVAARRAVRAGERETLLAQRMRLAALRRQERTAELAARREAREAQRVRRQAAQAMRGYRSAGARPSQARRTYAEVFGNPPTPVAAVVAAVADRMLGPAPNPRRRRNPGLASVVGEIAKDTVKGGLIAAAQEEAKEWRDRIHKRGGGLGYAIREELKEPHFGKPRRRPNPARLEPDHPDPRLRAMSRRFHGRPDQILHLDPDQRQPPPVHVVKIGDERAVVYRAPRGSQRAGAEWEHASGDVGDGRTINGSRMLVADEHGRVYAVRGTSRMTFDPDRGLVG